METELLTAPELARVLKITADTVWRYTRTGRIPCVRLGPRDYRYSLRDVLSALAIPVDAPETNEPSIPKQTRQELKPTDLRTLKAFAGEAEPPEGSR